MLTNYQDTGFQSSMNSGQGAVTFVSLNQIVECNLNRHAAANSEDAAELRARLDKLQLSQERMRRVNSYARNGNRRALVAMGFSDAQIEAFMSPERTRCGGFFPAYKLKNGTKKIRLIKDKLRELDAAQDGQSIEEEGNGYTYRIDSEERTISFQFLAKPSKDIRNALRKHGFMRKTNALLYERGVSTAALDAARQLRTMIDG
ncbi:MAG TPA: hypothetical protein VEC35_10980 [Noviherbaspirillum sp.]|nr:hypothetical protein [Noviherbaspirillum sp.]